MLNGSAGTRKIGDCCHPIEGSWCEAVAPNIYIDNIIHTLLLFSSCWVCHLVVCDIFFQGQTHFFVGRILCYVYFIPSAEFKMIVLCEYCSCMQKLKSFSLYDQKEEFVFGCDQGLEKGIVIFWLQFARFQNQGYTLETQSDCHALKHNTRSVI